MNLSSGSKLVFLLLLLGWSSTSSSSGDLFEELSERASAPVAALAPAPRASAPVPALVPALAPAPVPGVSTVTDPSELAVLRAVQAVSWASFVSTDPCGAPTNWPGISCTSSSTSTAYHISGIVLSGDTPRALATLLTLASELKQLQSLVIRHTASNISSSPPPSFPIPESLGQLEQLQELDLGDNGVHLGGPIPAQLGNLTGVTRLVLAGNHLEGPVPENLCGLSSLEHLDLSRNELQGSIPSCMGSFTSLELLGLGSNHLTQGIPEQLGALSKLRHLNLENNRLQGEIPRSLVALATLQTLRCGRNLLRGTLPEQLGDLRSLQVLDLSFNPGITGTIPSSVGDLTGLAELRLFSTGLNGSIPDEVGKLVNLTTLMLHSNLITGSIPESLSKLTKLELLQLQGNNLSGPLPGSLFAGLSSLQGLYLQSNNFTGSFPVELTRLSSLSAVNLGFNRLEGELPEELGNMMNLEWLLLAGNRFTGRIPASFSKLSKLRLLDLSSNLLNEALPSNMLAPRGIEYDLQFNAANSSALLHDLCFDSQCSRVEAISDSFAINSGGPSFNTSSPDEFLFEADTYVNASVGFFLVQPVCSSSSASWGSAVTGSADSSRILTSASPLNLTAAAGDDLTNLVSNQELYRTARVGGDSIAYYGRCMKPGTYTVELHFVELDDALENSPGRRVFDVLVQDQMVHERLDILEVTGATFVPLVQQYQAGVNSSSSTLKIELRGTGSWNTTDSYNGPIISGVRVFLNASSSSGASGGGSKSREIWAILGASAGVLVLICLGLFAALACWLRRAEKRARIMSNSPLGDEESNLHNSLSFNSQIGSLTSFEYSELVDATEKFAAHNLLGQGAHGRVFKGILPDGKIVAIKQLVHRTPTCKKWFHHELQVISSVRHRNLVPLIGCCIDQGFPLLVCEFMPNGSLQGALFSKESSPRCLSWELRVQIALDVARGLHYLHEDRGGLKIIHRDVKPANILLDQEMRAYISDFGLAKLMDHHGEPEVVVSSVMGTRGYLAPEYVLNGQLSEKADVYSYGIVLLELLSGKKGMQSSMNLSLLEPISIDEWAWEALVSGQPEAIADPRLGGKYSLDDLVKLVQIAMWCTQGLPEWRPGMGQVVQMLSDQIGIPELPSERMTWDDFKDVMVSGAFTTTSSVWETVHQSSMSGYHTANGSTLPDPKSHGVTGSGADP